MNKHSIFHPTRRMSLLRNASLIGFVMLMGYFGIRHQIVGGGPQGSPPLDSYCVFGGVETLWSYVTKGQFLQKTNLSNLVLLTAAVLVTLLTGASFCGWICPFGALQEWIGIIGKRLFGKQFPLPVHIDRPLRYLRFVLLALILYMTISTDKLWFEIHDPFKAFFGFEFELSPGLVILLLLSILSIFIERFFCKYLCPLGALFSLLSPLSIIKLKRQSSHCIGCNLCNKSCPMGIDVAHVQNTGGDCIRCLQCMENCPKPEALILESGKNPSPPIPHSVDYRR
ncbi:4Fe-4S binding protein [Heliobacillus mobilis]|uniref:4Fe-4S binding protein n=1 Tax=Heliobacterium mobile TaxID=28064 RepID=A0A6I3SK02_HELMO|nr:4Fe-4S binding protein [Heliobacterium mobile]MTV49229.1 4Fe-4S binding protein [Heliobacterium mobile]